MLINLFFIQFIAFSFLQNDQYNYVTFSVFTCSHTLKLLLREETLNKYLKLDFKIVRTIFLS